MEPKIALARTQNFVYHANVKAQYLMAFTHMLFPHLKPKMI